MDAFYKAYDRLALLGHCDDPGGAEYERVRQEWLEAGKPEIDQFIKRRANALPWEPVQVQ
jgi:hypothetical protein